MKIEEEIVNTEETDELVRVLRLFAIRGEVQFIKQIKKGYINRTYKVSTLSASGNKHTYILQRINTNVFRNVSGLMNNFWLVTEHLKNVYRLPGSRQGEASVLSLRLTKDGRTFLDDKTGCWRVVKCFDNVYSMDVVDSPETFGKAAEAFGLFIKKMSDLPLENIVETIPNFHNTLKRFHDLEDAISADPFDRVKEVNDEIEYLKSNVTHFSLISSALESGEIPLRICHNDCNLNNILFDNDSHLPVAVIDLDTVMPSSLLYDYGDSMRVGTNSAKDDEKDLSKVYCNLEMYEAYARGFLKSCGDIMTEKELEYLPYASFIITIEDGIRFLTDYINGDTYYKTDYKGQNLDRARTQLCLAKDMLDKLPQIKKILNGIYEEMGLKATL